MTSAAASPPRTSSRLKRKQLNEKQELNTDEDGRSPLIRLAIRPFSSRRHVHLLMLLYGELIFLYAIELSAVVFDYRLRSLLLHLLYHNIPRRYQLNV